MSATEKILEVIYSYETGGSERLGSDIAIYLHNKKYNISVCATHGGKGPISNVLESNGIECITLIKNRFLWPIKYLELFFILKKRKITVVHVHHVGMYLLCLFPAKLARVKKLILTEHTDYELKKDTELFNLARKYCKYANCITVIHNGLKSYFMDKLHIPESKVLVIKNGVNTRKFSPARRTEGKLAQNNLSINNDDFVIGTIGRLHPDKDHFNLINAIINLHQNKVFNIKLLVIGSGELYGEIQKYIEKNNAESYILLLGERGDIPELLSLFDLFVISSRTEGVPMVLLEAMSSGVPTLSTAVGGIPELINDTAGVLVEAEDSLGLAAAIQELIEDREKIRQIADKARSRILTEYDSNIMLMRYENLFMQ